MLALWKASSPHYLGLLCLNCGLLWGRVACYSGPLGFTGAVNIFGTVQGHGSYESQLGNARARRLAVLGLRRANSLCFGMILRIALGFNVA